MPLAEFFILNFKFLINVLILSGNKDIFQFGLAVGLADVEKYPYFRVISHCK